MAVGRKRAHPLISSGVFNALVEMCPKMTAAQIEMARMVMVEGRTMEWAGKNYNCSRQLVGYHVKQLENLLDDYVRARQIEDICRNLPDGWDMATLAGPAPVVARWKKEANEEANKLRKWNDTNRLQANPHTEMGQGRVG